MKLAQFVRRAPAPCDSCGQLRHDVARWKDVVKDMAGPSTLDGTTAALVEISERHAGRLARLVDQCDLTPAEAREIHEDIARHRALVTSWRRATDVAADSRHRLLEAVAGD